MLEIAGKSENFDYVKFFNSMSNIWAQVIPEPLFAAYAADTHPLNYLRINVNAQMFDPIYSKLGVVEGNGMYLAPDKRKWIATAGDCGIETKKVGANSNELAPTCVI